MFLRWRRSQQAKEKREDTQRLEIAGIATAPSLDWQKKEEILPESRGRLTWGKLEPWSTYPEEAGDTEERELLPEQRLEAPREEGK